MLSALIEPFQFSFMVNAMLVAAIVAVPCALLSVFLVLKGWALMGDAMSHGFSGRGGGVYSRYPLRHRRVYRRVVLRHRHRLSRR